MEAFKALYKEKAFFFLLAATFILALISWVRFLRYQDAIAHFPYCVNYGEGVVLDQAIRLSEGKGLYGPLQKEPYVVDNYTPLYPFLVSLTLKFSPFPWTGGRILTFISAIASACVLYFLVSEKGTEASKKAERDKKDPEGVGGWAEATEVRLPFLCGVLASGLFLCFREVLTWGALLRVDFLGVFLSLLGFYLVSFKSGLLFFFGSFVFFASLATRQSLVEAPLAVYLSLFLAGGQARRAALRGLSVLGLFAFLGLIFALGLTHGRFWDHTVASNVLPFELRSLWVKYAKAFIPTKMPLLLGAFFSWIFLRSDKDSRSVRLLSIFSLLSALSICRKGADVNYLLIPLAALSSLLCRGILKTQNAWKASLLVFLAFLQLTLSLIFERGRVNESDLVFISQRDSASLRVCAEISGPILFEEPSLAILSGRPVLFEPFMCTQLAKAGRWDPSGLIERIASRSFAAVQRTGWIRKEGERGRLFLLGDRTIPEVNEAIEKFYQPKAKYVFTRPIRPGLKEAYLFYFPR